VLALLFLGSSASCRRDTLPRKPSAAYNEAVKVFYVGLAALQVGDDIRADSKLSQLTQLVPDEPSGWGNWGVLALRQRNFDATAERLNRARSLAPGNDQILYLIGLMESARGRSQEAIDALEKSVKLNPRNLIALYRLAEEKERLSTENSLADVQALLNEILAADPRNLAVLVELGRIAAKRGDTQTLRTAVSSISEQSSGWPDDVKQQLTAVQTVVNGTDPAATAVRLTFLRNVLVRVPVYRQNLSLIKPPPGEEASPFTRLLRMESPTFTPAAPDTQMSFTGAGEYT
jgi:tetratricopeptide (TPR) repeat protein